MKKRLLSLMLVLAFCLGSAFPALAYGDMGKAGGYRQTISMNSSNSWAVKEDNSLWGWGENSSWRTDGEGLLGNGGGGNVEIEYWGTLDQQWHTRWIQTVPVKIMDGVAAICAGDSRSFAVKTDGTLWGWGRNTYGILGQIDLDAEFATPVRITDKVKLPTAPAPMPNAPATPSTPSTPTTNAVLSPQKLAVDGENISCEKYNIGGSNYFKLRDLAQLLNGTGSQFGVGFDAAASMVTITTGAAYESTGTELMAGGDKSSTAQPSAQSILIDGVKHDELTAYNIGGSNFFQLRELGNILGFEVGYDQDTNTAIVHSVQK